MKLNKVCQVRLKKTSHMVQVAESAPTLLRMFMQMFFSQGFQICILHFLFTISDF